MGKPVSAEEHNRVRKAVKARQRQIAKARAQGRPNGNGNPNQTKGNLLQECTKDSRRREWIKKQEAANREQAEKAYKELERSSELAKTAGLDVLLTIDNFFVARAFKSLVIELRNNRTSEMAFRVRWKETYGEYVDEDVLNRPFLNMTVSLAPTYEEQAVDFVEECKARGAAQLNIANTRVIPIVKQLCRGRKEFRWHYANDKFILCLQK